MVRFVRQLLCNHPFVVSVQRHRGRGWWHGVTCVRCGKEW